jgi:hypothetical protein
MSVVSTQDAGFFSCCSILLTNIVLYINEFSKLPESVDSSKSFNWYKNERDDRDITYEYFQHYDNIKDITTNSPIDYLWNYQYKEYSKLEYNNIVPLVKKYFSPSNNILTILETMEKKYSLEYNNICVLFYRGNDKNRETKICGYEEYLHYANLVLEQNPNLIFLIQSDETEFIEFAKEKFPSKHLIFYDEIRHIPKCNNTVDVVMKDKNFEFSKFYLAITIIMSKCKYIICGSGNCSIWIMLYRENGNNVYQNYEGKWYTP